MSQAQSSPLPPLSLRRTETDAGPTAVADLLRALDDRPGMYYGSDYASDPVFRHEARLFIDPAVRLELAAGTLALQPLDSAGAAIVRHWATGLPGAWRSDGAYLPALPSWDPSGETHHPATVLLRTLLAQFTGETRDLALFGCWNADYWRLEKGSGSDPSPARAVLYLPLSFLAIHGAQARQVRFSLDPKVLAASAGWLATAACPPSAVAPRQDDFPNGGFADRVALAVEAMARGEVLSVALSQAFRRHWSASMAMAFASLRRRYPMPEMYCVHLGGGEYLLGASPCMQARLQDGLLDIAPVCGTAPRGADAMADASHALALLQSDKEGAALALGTDAHLARLHSLCEPGSVDLFAYRRVHHFQALIHEMAHIGGRLSSGKDWLDVLLATSATATSTGVPKREALALIAATEASPRGWYTGAVGRVGVDGSLRLGTIMRPAWVRGDVVEIRTGGLLVSQSDPAQEEEETRVKAASLLNLLSTLEGSSDASAAAQSKPDANARPTLWLSGGRDPLLPITAGLLARCGAHVVPPPTGASTGHTAVVRVLTGLEGTTPPLDFSQGPPTLLLGAVAEQALEYWGWHAARSANLQPGLTLTVNPCPTGPLADFGSFPAGDYRTCRFSAAHAQAGLTALATDGDGSLLAFQHETLPVIGLLFRPESVLTSGSQAGLRLFARLLNTLAPNAFPPASGDAA